MTMTDDRTNAELAEDIREAIDENQMYRYFDQQTEAYADRDQMDRYDIETTHEWYTRFGSGEVESDVLHWVGNEVDADPNDRLRNAILTAYPDAPV